MYRAINRNAIGVLTHALIVCAVVLVFTSAAYSQAYTTLLSDSFVVTGTSVTDLSANLATRQIGTLAPITYSTDRVVDWQVALNTSYSAQTMLVCPILNANPAGIHVSPDTDFSGYLAATRVSSTVWASFQYVDSPALDNSVGIGIAGVKLGDIKSKLAFTLKGTGAWSAYDSGAVVASGTISTHATMGAPWHDTVQELRKSGSTYLYSLWIDNVQLVTDHVVSFTPTTNYVTLCGYADGTQAGNAVTGHIFRNLSVQGIPSVVTPGSLTGQVSLQGFSGDYAAVGMKVELAPISNGAPLTAYVKLDSAGNYTVDNVVPGTYNVYFKPAQFLRKLVTPVTITSGLAETRNVTLTNGDLDGDNEVTSTDLSIVLK